MHKNYVTNFRGENDFTPDSKIRIKDEPLTPLDDFDDHYQKSFDNEYGGMKKSMSMTDIASLRECMRRIEMEDGHDSCQTLRKTTSTGAPHDMSRTKFVSMAEAIYHFQRDTPGRFHSSKPTTFQGQKFTGPSGLTIPQSPMLRSKSRSRPMHVMSQKEKEEMELEEIRKFKIKANPIPKAVIEGSKNLPDVPKKPVTVPEPFHLTDIPKKTMSSPQIQKFKARPAPKHILEKPQVPVKLPVHVTKPVSPKLSYKRSNSADHLIGSKPCARIKSATKSNEKPIDKPVPRHGPLRPEPFSFEKRDEEMKKKKEERIKQQIKEERKQASLFKAQPLPGAVKKRMHVATAKCSSSTTSSENKENHVKFEARPPSVLFKEPFKPVLQPTLVKPVPFELTTEKRAADREKFDQLIKEKEEAQEKMRLLREKERREAEEKAMAKLRAKLVHHAKPVPENHPFVPEKSETPLTVPETPKFVRRLKQR